MSNPYTSVSVSGYNADAPSDDGSAVASNQLTWAKHKDKLADPLKTAIEAVNSNISTAFGKIFGTNISSQSSNYTITTADQGKFFEATATLTFTLPAVASSGSNFALAIVNTSSGLVTIDGNASETINGVTSIYLGENEGAIITSDGSSWTAVVSQNFPSRIQSKSGDYTAVATDDRSLIEFTASATLTLLAAATAGSNFKLLVINTSGSALTIDGATSETINGETSIQIGHDGSAFLFCDGSQWLAILGGSPTQRKTKTSDESVTSSTTLQDDDELTGITLEADTWYRFDAFLLAGSASATPDFKFQLTFSQTPQNRMFAVHTVDEGAVQGGDANDLSAAGTPSWSLNAGDDRAFNIRGSFQTNASAGGTLKLQWAQNTSDATATTVRAGSWMEAEK